MNNRFTSLDDLFYGSLRDLYSTEHYLIALIPRMANSTSWTALCRGISANLERSKDHVRRIEDICAKQEISLRGNRTLGIADLISEGELLLGQPYESDMRDAILISWAQKLNQYEIASYKASRTLAENLGYCDAAEILGQTLKEETQAERWLADLRDHHIQSYSQ